MYIITHQICNCELWRMSFKLHILTSTYVLFCWLHLIIHNSIWMNFQFKSLHIDLSCTFMCPRCVAKLEVKPDLCSENLSWQLKIWKQNFGQGKRVTIFHVAWVMCNCKIKTLNGCQKFDITEKTIILNFYYYKLKRFYNRDPFIWDWHIFMIFH